MSSKNLSEIRVSKYFSGFNLFVIEQVDFTSIPSTSKKTRNWTNSAHCGEVSTTRPKNAIKCWPSKVGELISIFVKKKNIFVLFFGLFRNH